MLGIWCNGVSTPDSTNLLIEHCYLDLANLEAMIEDRLLSHGSQIDPETRYFLSQVRDALHKSSSHSMAWLQEHSADLQ